MSNVKCRAKGGVASCKNPNCPEKRANFESFKASVFNTTNPATVTEASETKKQDIKVNGKRVGSWSEKDTVLFKAIHGSTLYGLNHADSDEDFYVVTPTWKTSNRINASQKIKDGVDTLAVDFSSFVEMARKGAPQALEAMFSRKDKSEFFEEFRNNYYAADPEVYRTYMRTIKNFSYSDTFKLRRHALRLATNLNELMHTGRFNPTLSTKTIDTINKGAELEGAEYFKFLTKYSPLEVDWDLDDKKSF